MPVGFQLGEGIQHAPSAEKACPLRPLLEKRKARLRRTALPFQFRLGANAVFADSLAQPVGDRPNAVSQFAELAEIPAQFVRRQHRSDKVDEQREVGERQNPLSERGRKQPHIAAHQRVHNAYHKHGAETPEETEPQTDIAVKLKRLLAVVPPARVKKGI